MLIRYSLTQTQSIRSCSRPLMNQRLVEALPLDIKTRFDTKLTRIDLRSKVAYGLTQKPTNTMPGDEAGPSRSRDQAQPQGKEVEVPFDLIIGCDGAWSKVRTEMMRAQR